MPSGRGGYNPAMPEPSPNTAPSQPAPDRAEASDRPTRIRVDLGALTHNLRALRDHVGVPVMGIVKADAYGHGLVPVARHLEAQGIAQLGVAFVEEGLALLPEDMAGLAPARAAALADRLNRVIAGPPLRGIFSPSATEMT